MMDKKIIIRIDNCDYIDNDYDDLVQYSEEHYVIEEKRLEKQFFDMLDNLYIEKDKFNQLNDVKTFLNYLKTTDKAEKVVNDIIDFLIDECYCEAISAPKNMNDEKLEKFFNHSIEEFDYYIGAKNLKDLAEYNFFEYFSDLDGLDLVEYFEKFGIYAGTAGYSQWAQFVTTIENCEFCSDLWDGYNFYNLQAYEADEKGHLTEYDSMWENYITNDDDLKATIECIINSDNTNIYLWNNENSTYFNAYKEIDVVEDIEYTVAI